MKDSAEAPAPWRPRAVLRRLLWIVLGTFVAGYVAVCVVIYAIQGQLVYFPDRNYAIKPPDLGLKYEDLRLVTDDGETIAAWFVPHENPSATLLFCHGNAGNMAHRLETLKSFHRLGYSVLIFDYRGYGTSTGMPNEQGTYRDGEAALAWLRSEKGLDARDLVFFGRSLGGAVAIELAHRHPPAALVVECTLSSLVEIGQQEYPLLPVSLLATNRYEASKKVPAIRCPKLFLHGRDDEIIPVAQARRLFAAAAEPKRFIATPGGHNVAGFEYNNATRDALDTWLRATIGAP